MRLLTIYNLDLARYSKCGHASPQLESGLWLDKLAPQHRPEASRHHGHQNPGHNPSISRLRLMVMVP